MTRMQAPVRFPRESGVSLEKKRTPKKQAIRRGIARPSAIATYHQAISSFHKPINGSLFININNDNNKSSNKIDTCFDWEYTAAC